MSSIFPSTINNLTIPLNPLIISNNLCLCSKKSIISCKNHKNNNENPNKTPILDRRNMLIGLGGLYGSTLNLTTESPANAEPMAPDVYACTLTDAQWENSVGDHCCPPKFPDIINDFSFEDYPSPVLKIRRPAHVVSKDPEFVHDYNRAIGIMRTGLTPFDPRNFYQQAKIHCAYCDDAYPQLNNPVKRLEIHNSWLFMSFHRWYFFFFERIMGKLINKPEFALPYWNWDHPDGMRIPEMFKDVDSQLYDSNRNVDRLSSVIDLNLFSRSKDDRRTNEELIQENLVLMRKQMVYPSKPSLFFGEKYKLGDDIDRKSGAGSIESSPHNVVHGWMGSATVRGGQDMGAFWSAARDPIFYSHHSNVDRMWHLWRTELPGRSRVDIHDPDYLNAWFVFYDENANPVKVKIRDSFDIEKLGYTYEKVELPWLYKRPPTHPPPPITKTPLKTAVTESMTFPKALDSVIKTQVARPGKKRTTQEKEEQEEVLLIEFELCHADKFVKFDVYINDPTDHSNDDDNTQGVTPEMAGTFTALPHREMHKNGKDMNGKDEKISKCSLKLALNTLLEEIGAEDNDIIEVALVPRSGTDGIDITAVKIEFASN